MQLKSRIHRYATYIALALIAIVVVISASGASSLLGAKNGTKPGVAGGQLEAGLNRALGKGVKRSNLGAILAPANSALWGAWVAPVNGQTSAQAVAALETQMGRPLDIVHQYEAFDETWPNATQTSWADGGRILLANISARQKSGSILTWTAIANGSNDSTIDALAGRLKTFGHQVYISFDEEPESRYHDDPATFTLASFVAAFRHLHDRMAANGVTNVSWVWNVTGYIGNASIYPSLYPGDSYVDWIAWDPYNWYNCSVNTTNKWESFDTVIQPFYDWVAGGHLSSGAATKPLMLAEYGSVENSGSPTKGQWFTDAVSTLPSRPLLKAVVYYDENKDCNWPITTSQSSTSGFAAASLNCYVYSGGSCTLTTACRSVTDAAAPATATTVGIPVTVTATALNCPSPLFEFWIKGPGATTFSLARGYGSDPVFNWNTSGLAVGTYRFNVWVRDNSSPGIFGNASGRWDAYNASLLYTLTALCPVVGDTAKPAAAAMPGIPVAITASAPGCPNPLYEFWVLAPGAGAYTLGQPYSSSAVFNWTTTGLAIGAYRINVWVHDASHSGTFGNSSGRWDSYNATLLYTLTAGCPSVADTAAPASTAAAGTPVGVTASAPGCLNPLYEFWVLAPGAAAYTLAQPYSSSAVFNWTTTGLARGTYRINVWVRDNSSPGVFGNSSGRWDAYNAHLLYTLT